MSAISLAVYEINRLNRRERSHWLRSLYLAFLATATAFSWLSECSPARLWTEQEGVGLVLFRRFAILQFLLLNLTVILDLCLSLSEEKRAGSLDLLLTSPLSSFQIALAKFLAALLPAALLLAAGLPIFFALLLFGGLSASRVVFAFSLTLASAGLSAAMALAASSLVRRPTISVLLTSALLGLYTRIALRFAWLSNPYVAFARLWEDDSRWGWNSRLAPSACLSAAALVGFLLLLAAVFLRRLPQYASAPPKEWRGAKNLMRHSLPRAACEADANAFLWREVGGWISGLRQGMRLWLWAFLILCAWLAYLLLSQPAKNAANALGSATGLLWLQVVALVPLLIAASRAFAVERSRKTLELIISSPACETELLTGKMLAIFLRFGPLLSLPAIYAASLAWQHILPPYISLISAWCMAVAGGFLAIFAVFASMFVRPLNAIWFSLGSMLVTGGMGWFCASGLAFLGISVAPERVFLPYWLIAYNIDLAIYAEAPARLFADLIFCLGWHVLLALLCARIMAKGMARFLRYAV